MAEIKNFFQINDWEFKKFISIILAIQLCIWGMIILNFEGFKLPLINEVIGFIYLTFVPGILILRILKLHQLGSIETLLYSIGLSISTLMFIGLFINFLLPLFGITRPISTIPMVLTLSIEISFLCLLSYIRDKDFFIQDNLKLKHINFDKILILSLIPFLAIFGTVLYNIYNNYLLLIILLIIISLLTMIIGFKKNIPGQLYPFIIWIISISILFHKSLLSQHIWGWDIQTEYYFSNLVLNNGYWDWQLYHSYNGVISTNILAPIYSIFCKININWVFKIIYPLIFSFVPLGLYVIFEKQTNRKIAFFACFYFISVPVFYGEILQLARQIIAEIFLVLLILLIVDKNLEKNKKSLLLVIFSTALIMSHYGLSYLYMGIFLLTGVIVLLDNKFHIINIINKIKYKFNNYKESQNSSTNFNDRIISLTFILFFIVLTLGWYIYVSSSYSFISIVELGSQISSSIYTDFLNPTASQGLFLINQKMDSPLHNLNKYLYFIFQFSIVLGFFYVLFINNLIKVKTKFNSEYMVIASISLFICLLSILVPFFASALNTTRIYHIVIIVLSPFTIIGLLYVLTTIKNRLSLKQDIGFYKIISIILAVSFLLNSGVIYTIANDDPPSLPFNDNVQYPIFNQKEVGSMSWLIENKVNNSTIYVDNYQKLLLDNYNPQLGNYFPKDPNFINNDSYLFFGTYNLDHNTADIPYRINAMKKKSSLNINTIIIKKNKIFDNGGSNIFYNI